MKDYLPLFLLIMASCSNAQSDAEISSFQQIDKEIWEVFKTAYKSNDGPLYVGIHSDDIIRVTKRGIRQGAEWKNETLDKFSRPSRRKSVIDFVFEHRIHKGKLAYEVGYYSLYYLDDVSKVYYGRFHVVLKLIDGVWKITQDWDTDNVNGHEVGEADFNRLKG